MSDEIHGNYINGEWLGSDAVIENISPSDTSDVVGRYAKATVQDCENAIAAATAAFEGWSQSALEERKAILDRIGAELIERSGEIGRVLAREEGKTLAEVALEIDLGEHILLGPGELKSGGFRRESILADCLEAVLGAILIDSDYVTCRKCVLSLFSSRLEAIEPGQQKDPKTRLQEYLQARGRALPDYQLVNVSGDDHDQTFTVECVIAEQTYSAEGSSRRRAEQGAAESALLELEQGKSA